MRKIVLLLGLVLFFGCIETKKKDCERFNLLESNTKISKIILLEQKEEIEVI